VIWKRSFLPAIVGCALWYSVAGSLLLSWQPEAIRTLSLQAMTRRFVAVLVVFCVMCDVTLQRISSYYGVEAGRSLPAREQMISITMLTCSV